jgi:3-hydroxyisobutyrate dehydrogenase-like beta-hydroxyacid dehydrogenase
MKRLGFVGVGAMGGRMVPNLIRAGFEVSVVDVSPEAVRRAVAAGAFTMGKAEGVDPRVLHEVIRTSSGGGWVMEKDPPCPRVWSRAHRRARDFRRGSPLISC